MQELKINKTFNTYEEMLEEEKRLSNEYMVILINHTKQNVGENVYGIDSICHFGKR